MVDQRCNVSSNASNNSAAEEEEEEVKVTEMERVDWWRHLL
jgi:hypothetical protein